MLKSSKLIILCSVLFMTMIACKKESNDPASSGKPYFTAKLDGNKVSCSDQVVATKMQLAQDYTLTIAGLKTNGGGLYIELWSSADFHKGDVFHSDANTSFGGVNTVTWSEKVLNSNETNLWTSYSPFTLNDPVVTITITEINSEFVKGTFSGVIYQDVNNPLSKTVTEGEFFAKFSL